MENLGRYQIIEQLGAGAMGTVYKARDPMMGRDVAIKTILTSVIEGPQAADFRERFFREARAAGRLTHPGIVTVFDVSEHEGTPFLVMEYIAGRTLQNILESGERMTIDQVCDLSIQLAEALDYAHRNNVIHRDIKPANILITSDNRVKIADFGVARLADAQVTTTGYLLGTPAFMSPEQFTGAPIDGRADIFSAGVVIYWMTTGDKPFSGDSILSVQYKVVNADPVPPRKLNPAMPRDFETVILKTLAKDPADRYQSGEELAADLRSIRGGQPAMARTAIIDSSEAPTLVVPSKTLETKFKETKATVIAGPPSTVIEAPGRPRRSPWIIAAVLIVVFVLGAAFARFRITRRQESGNQQQPEIAAVDNKSPLQPTPAQAAPPPPAPPPSTSKSTESAKSVPPKEPAAKKPAPQPAPAPVKPDTISLQLVSRERNSVVFEAPGQATQTLLMQAGESASLKADKQATLIVTNPGALQVQLNGNSVSLGTERRAGRFTVTPDSIEPFTAGTSNGRGVVPGMPDLSGLANVFSGRGNPNAFGTPARQKELAQAADSVRLLMKSSAIPEFLTLVIRVDNLVFFRRDATAPAPEGFDKIPRRFPTGTVQSVPLAEERLIPPGSHQIQASLLFGTARIGAPADVSADFAAGQRQTLSIELVQETQRGRGSIPRLQLTLQ